MTMDMNSIVMVNVFRNRVMLWSLSFSSHFIILFCFVLNMKISVDSAPKKQCTQDTDCDIFSDFLCLEDPLCSGSTTVCVDINFQWDCTSDADCHGGYECMPWNDGMKCGKYDRS